MADLQPFIRFWHALDAALERVVETPWGAVVTDRRFPSIWDVNYARVDAERDDVTLEEVQETLTPELERSGSRWEHVVCFFPERQTGLIAELGMRGNRLSWDVVMAYQGRPPEPPGIDVEEVVSPDAAFWANVRTSLSEFDVTEREALDQLDRLEREVALPDGKRWFAIRSSPGGPPLALGALIPHEGVGYLDHIVTFPAARRRGLGSAMVDRIVGVALRDGAEHIYLLADRGGKPADLYRRLGFSEVAYLASSVRKR
jgi:ribosomal protein S18 acetylase RimI-like enzyme